MVTFLHYNRPPVSFEPVFVLVGPDPVPAAREHDRAFDGHPAQHASAPDPELAQTEDAGRQQARLPGPAPGHLQAVAGVPARRGAGAEGAAEGGKPVRAAVRGRDEGLPRQQQRRRALPLQRDHLLSKIKGRRTYISHNNIRSCPDKSQIQTIQIHFDLPQILGMLTG